MSLSRSHGISILDIRKILEKYLKFLQSVLKIRHRILISDNQCHKVHNYSLKFIEVQIIDIICEKTELINYEIIG